MELVLNKKTWGGHGLKDFSGHLLTIGTIHIYMGGGVATLRGHG